MAYILLFIIGVSVGSFLNVVSLRYRSGEKLFSFRVIGGRSRCQNCQRSLGAFELIPLLSFVFQKGKCRSCGVRLSFQYPLVEALAGFIFVLVPMRLFALYLFASVEIIYLLSFLWILFFLTLLLISIIDFRHYIIPDSLNFFIAGLGAALILIKIYGDYGLVFHDSFLLGYSMFMSFVSGVLANHFVGVTVGAGLFGLIIYLTKGAGMGFGDLKLAAVLGIALGWPDVFFAIIFAFLIGGAVSIPLLFGGPSTLLGINKKTMKSALPFGPFLAFGTALLFFAGFEILELYFMAMGLL
ncbi:hypothetical protein A3A20_00435 [Candidatus Wolfebacteria bacterium RIFCSPLOWO2_01_FULL_45_19]|uniref:Prepilin peptidase n=1 Tax=Candidatus Wolfebacteria bacterium RIFCSPLOWO2_01_FULL_45_19 TaxID=1802557 RepID=A0A1F8DSV1_9BACT|nr:MAG: hypothetical protein A3A20_00435 [Candidatus Wolfebacteria bacterium RIFCSPLOWO2_01_FULL_45_19]